jgi:lysophospholipase L1-like esterase
VSPRRLTRRLRPEPLLALGSVLALLAALGGLELAARQLDPRYLDRTRGPDVYSSRLGWRLRPGFQGPMHDVWTTINSSGHRGRAHTGEAAPGRQRIVMLGDSITFGHRLPDDQTFSSLLEARSRRFEVVNLGVEGYGTDQQLLVLLDEGLRYGPDVVILNFCSNDVVNNALDKDHQDGRTPKPYFTLEAGELRLHDSHVRLSRLRSLAQWLADESHLFARLGDLAPALAVERRGFDEALDTAPLRRRPEAVELTTHLVRRIAAVSKRAGADFLLVMHADEPGLLEHSGLTSRITGSPLLAGLRVLDMAERFRAQGLEKRAVLLDYQGHLTPLGSQLVAREIEIALASTLIQGSAPPAPPRSLAAF